MYINNNQYENDTFRIALKQHLNTISLHKGARISDAVKKYDLKLLDYILLNYTSNSKSRNQRAEKIFNYANNIKAVPICPVCNINQLIFLTYVKGYTSYCSNRCGSIGGSNLRKQTMKVKYGSEHALQNKEIFDKFQKTMIGKYDVPFAMQSTELQQRFQTSMKTNHGVSHPSKSEIIYKNRNRAMQEKYGVEHAMQNSMLSDRQRTSMMEVHGVKFPLQSESIRKTMQRTMKQRYGKDFAAQVDHIFLKVRNTNMNRHGVELPLQNTKIKEQWRNKMEYEGKWISRELLTDFQIYYKEVWKVTNQQELNTLDNFDKRGLAGIDGAYHVDHKISIKYGFQNCIPPYVIGNIYNLEMLTWENNIYKSSKCSVEPDILFQQVFKDSISAQV